MFKRYNVESGLPARIYRSPQEIRCDISEISIKIAETEKMLNIRSMLVEILSDERLGSPEKLIPMLEDAVAEAGEALAQMKRLEEELNMLKEELYEVRWKI